jgi:hypothetical protein
VIATVVDTAALGKVVAASLIAGIGVTAVFAVGILGATRFADMRRDARPIEAALFAIMGSVALLACLAAAVVGIVVMTTK